MSTIWTVMTRLSTGLALTSVGCLLALSALTAIDVLGRYAFGRPIPGFTNAAALATALATALAVAGFFPVLTMRKANITLRPFAKVGGKVLARILDTFAALVTTAFFAVMAWQYADYAAEAVRSGEYVAVLRWPVGPWWWGVAVMIAITAVAAFVVFIQETRGRADPGEG
jgi:TRAP-type C4-dicarboxylate transport system permease small subunit